MKPKIKKATPTQKPTNAKEHKLGRGVFGWNSNERVSDRYGAVAIYENGKVVLDLKAAKKLVGKRGRLVAHVEETRESHHIGDLFRGIGPTTPKKGEKIVLGEVGTFFVEPDAVGTKPDEERESDWLDPRSLYRAHDQTVRLVFE